MQLFYSFFRHSPKRQIFMLHIFSDLHIYRNKNTLFCFLYRSLLTNFAVQNITLFIYILTH